MYITRILTFLLFIWFGPTAIAQQNSIVLLHNQLESQLSQATQAVAAMRTLELNFIHHQENLPVIHITYDDSQLSNYTPIAEIKAGFVTDDNNAEITPEDDSHFSYLNSDHLGQLCIEVKFKDNTQQSDIALTLSGKIIAFCAIGGNLTNDLINQTILEDGDPTHGIITGWVCYNPSEENNGFPMGTIDLDGDGTPANLLTGMKGPPWSMCSYEFSESS